MITKRLAIVALDVVGPGAGPARLYEDAGVRWLFDPRNPLSIPSYWWSASGGQVDIRGSEVFGAFTVPDPALVAAIHGPKRHLAASAAAGVVARFVDVTAFDGLVLVLLRGMVDAGTTSSVRVPNHVPLGPEPDPAYREVALTCALLDEHGPHSFIAHEVGHVVGLGHSFQSSWTNPYGVRFGEYGDPTDIMSALTFGDVPSGYAIPAVAGCGIADAAPLWKTVGPGSSPAIVWRHGPQFGVQGDGVRVVPADTDVEGIELQPVGRPGVRLAAVPHPLGGWLTAELRRTDQPGPDDWDRNVRQGVVVHRIRDIGTAADGTAYPKRQAVDYLTTIQLPSAGDASWHDAWLGVRVVEPHGDAYRILVGRALPGDRAVRLTTDVAERVVSSAPAGLETIPLTGPDCGPQQWVMDLVASEVTYGIELRARGMGRPVFTVSVAGAVLPSTATAGGAAAGPSVVTVTVPVSTPITSRRWSGPSPQAVPVTWSITGDRLTLTPGPGIGRFELDLVVTATDADVPGDPGVSVLEVLPVTNLDIWMPPQAVERFGQCLREQVEEESKNHLDPHWQHWTATELLRLIASDPVVSGAALGVGLGVGTGGAEGVQPPPARFDPAVIGRVAHGIAVLEAEAPWVASHALDVAVRELGFDPVALDHLVGALRDLDVS